MPQSDLIKPAEVEVTAPTTVVQLSSVQENAGGGYFHPQNPENPLPQHHTIQLTNLDELFAGKVVLQTIETPLEQAEPLITANRKAIGQAQRHPEWRKPFEQALLAHEDAHRTQEIRFKIGQLQELPSQASQKLRDLDIDQQDENAYLDKLVELDACILYADALSEAQAYAQMFKVAQTSTQENPRYARFLTSASLSPALKLFELAKPSHSRDTATETNLERLYNLVRQNLPIDDFDMRFVANQLGLIMLLTQNAQIIGDIQAGSLTLETLQDDLLGALAQSLDHPTDFLNSHSADHLAKAIDLQLMDYVTKARQIGLALKKYP